jgi:hypothetical protein
MVENFLVIKPPFYGPSHLHLFQRLLHGVHHCLVVCEEQEAALRLDEVLNLGVSQHRFRSPWADEKRHHYQVFNMTILDDLGIWMNMAYL